MAQSSAAAVQPSAGTTRGESSKPVIIAAVQDSPVSFDLDASTTKLQSLTTEAARRARQEDRGKDPPVVVIFPEAFLSCYPRGYDFGAKIGARSDEGRAWFRHYHSSAVPVSNVEGQEMRAIRQAARDNRVTLVVGVIERCDEVPSGPPPGSYGSTNAGGAGTLYCTALTISPEGELLSSHRKLMPTGSERLVWGMGDGAGLRVASTPAGKVGAVICWENYMPLLRFAMYSQGVEIYAAPTADSRDTWISTMQHIAMEGRCFVVSCCQYNTRADYPDDYPALNELSSDDVVCRGGSVIVGPMGQILAGPIYDKSDIIVARVDRAQLLDARMDFDPTGHYARPDVFSLHVDQRSKNAATSL